MRIVTSSFASLCVDHWPAVDAPPGLPTCVLIHGFSDNRSVWSRVGPRMSSFLPVLAPDLRGHGGSDWDSEGAYTCAKYADDILDLLAAMAVENVVLIGHSMGGNVALTLCHRLGPRALAAMLVDTNPNAPAELRAQILRDFADGDRSFASIEEYFAWLQNRRPLSDPDCLQNLAVNSLKRYAGGFLRCCDPSLGCAGSLDFDLPPGFDQPADLIASLDCELHLLRGRLSGVLDRNTQLALASAMRRGSCEEIEMAGHAVMSDNPTTFQEIAIAFAKRLAVRQAAMA
jgi:pimeloyl-ACP methyl ester carboxylesterase